MSPLPTANDVRPIDPILTDLSLGYKNESYFWDMIAPPVPVAQASGTYFRYDRDYWFRRGIGGDRAPANTYNRVGFGVSTDTYVTSEKGWEEAVDDVTRKKSQTPESLDNLATMHLVEIMSLEYEKLVSDALWKAGVWGTSRELVGTDKWSDLSGSDPINDSEIAKRIIRRNTGQEPNLLAIGAVTWEKLKEHPKILDKYKYTQVGIMTEALVAAALGIEMVVVLKSVENTAHEGAPGVARFTGEDIWTDNALYLKITPTPGLMVPNGAYTFVWDGDPGAGVPWGMSQWRDEPIRSDVQRIIAHPVVKLVEPQYGYMLTDTNS